MEPHALHRAGLGAEGRELRRQGGGVVGGAEGRAQAYFSARGSHGRRQRRALALVDPPRRPVEAVGVAADQEDRRAQPLRQVVSSRSGRLSHGSGPVRDEARPPRPPPPRDAREPLSAVPPEAVDVVGQGDAPARRRGDAQGDAQRVQILLDGRVGQVVEPGDPGEGAGGERQAPEAVALADAQLVPAGGGEGAGDQVAGSGSPGRLGGKSRVNPAARCTAAPGKAPGPSKKDWAAGSAGICTGAGVEDAGFAGE